jgi:VTC domain
VTYALRLDRKYLLPESVVEAFLDVDPNSWELDRVSGFASQRYETLYFDTAELQFFHAARGKHPLRSKVRLRHYLETGDRFLEVKRRNARGETTKVRTPWNGSLGADAEFLGDSLGASAPKVETLQPVALTAYKRVAYRLGDLGRMTIDKSLRFGPHTGVSHYLLDPLSLPSGEAPSSEVPSVKVPSSEVPSVEVPSSEVPSGEAPSAEYVIVETKSVDLSPTPLDRILWDLGWRPRSLSKYALAIGSFHPEIPLNRWAQVAADLQPLGLCT